MATVMEMTWAGVTPEQYDEARERVAWEDAVPLGGLFHVAWFADGALHVVDVWESQGAFEAFAHDRLMPVVQGELGLPGEPAVRFAPVHRVFDAARGEVRA
jgi:hypothetical protein